ncbi:uncharacterized protein [Dermacentor andersoni]|uniref:uncharacterized protein n=1 Tax=Dermacentor andersoni TaxID=34620 RepID=UPI003B3A0471
MFLLACAFLLFLLLLCGILVFRQLFPGDTTKIEDHGGDEATDGNQAFGKYGGSRGTKSGGATKSTRGRPTPTAATSADVQPPATRGQHVSQMTPSLSSTTPPTQQRPSVRPLPSPPAPKITPVPPSQTSIKPTSTRMPPLTPKAIPVPSTPPPRTPPPTTLKPSPPPPATTTPKQPTSTTLKPPGELPPTLGSMICTVASEGAMELPPDGLCNFIFYDSLRDPFEKIGRPSRGNFKTFQSLAAAGKQTQFGVSISAV